MALVAGGLSSGGKSAGGGGYPGRKRDLAYEDETVACSCIFKPKDPLKKNRAQLLKERIRQFSIWYYENEEQREEQHVRRRFDRENKRSERRKHGIMRILRFYLILTACVALVGSVFTLCSTVKALGEYSFMYRKKHVYRIVGPSLLGLSTLMYLLATAIKHKKTKSSRRKGAFYIVERKSSDKGKVPVSREASIETADSGNVEDIEMQTMPKRRIAMPHEVVRDNPGKLERVVKRGFGLKYEQSQNDSEFQDVRNQSTNRVSDAWQSRTDKRRAWAKTKWMRLEAESQDSVTDNESIDVSDPILSKSSVTQYDNPRYGAAFAMPQNESIEPFLMRDMSVKSKDSTSTNFSTQSETRPLIFK